MTDRVSLLVDELFGLRYWPALPAFLVSTISPDGEPHVAPFSLVLFASYTDVADAAPTPRVISFVKGDYGSLVAVKSSTTYRNVVETGEFVVNVPTVGIVQQLNRTGRPGPDAFGRAGLTPARSTAVRAPAVEECPIHYECRLVRIEDLRLLGEVISGHVVAVRVERRLAETADRERMPGLAPIYHYAYDHLNGTYYELGSPLLEEAETPQGGG